MRANPDRQRHLPHARSDGHRVPPAPNRRALKTRKKTMSGIWRSLVMKPKSATRSGQRTTTSTPNIISDRCARTQKGRKRLCCDGRLRQGSAGVSKYRTASFSEQLVLKTSIGTRSRRNLRGGETKNCFASMIKGESMSPPAMFDLGNSEATGTSRQFGLALIVCFLICEWQGLIGRG